MTTVKQLKELLNEYNDNEELVYQFYTRNHIESIIDRKATEDDFDSIGDFLMATEAFEDLM